MKDRKKCNCHRAERRREREMHPRPFVFPVQTLTTKEAPRAGLEPGKLRHFHHCQRQPLGKRKKKSHMPLCDCTLHFQRPLGSPIECARVERDIPRKASVAEVVPQIHAQPPAATSASICVPRFFSAFSFFIYSCWVKAPKALEQPR